MGGRPEMIIDLIGAIWKAIDLGARSGAGVELNSLQCGVLVEKEHALRA
jgi:hypothetical protein